MWCSNCGKAIRKGVVMKNNIIIAIRLVILFAFAILGIENPILAFNRPFVALALDFCIIASICGYMVVLKSQKETRQKIEMLKKYLERCKNEKEN